MPKPEAQGRFLYIGTVPGYFGGEVAGREVFVLAWVFWHQAAVLPLKDSW